MNGELIVVHDATDDKNDTVKMSKQEAREFHKRNYRVTIVGLLQPNNTIIGGISLCSGNDTFNRFKGTNVAKSRMCKNPIVLGSLLGKYTEHERKHKATEFIKHYGRRLRKAASTKRHHALRELISKNVETF